MKEISQNLKVRRLLLGEKQSTIASSIGVAVSTYRKWEQGVRNPPVTILPAVAKFLSCEVGDLFICLL